MNIKIMALQVCAATVLLTATSSAFALSCMKPNPVMQCKELQKSDTTSPAFADGQLKLSKIISQEVGERNIGGKGPAVAEYLFSGNLSDKTGKREVKNKKITITTSCAGPWCARLPENNKTGYFLLKTQAYEDLKLHLGACTFQPFQLNEQQVKDMEACVTPEPVKPEVVQNKGGSQVYSQRNKEKKLVK